MTNVNVSSSSLWSPFILIEKGDVPSRCELERALQRVACGKACGPDEIPGELLHCAAGEFSLPMFQLLLKMSVRRDEPLLWKGGLQLHLWKGKGSPSICASHRGILVSSVVGKAAHSVLRARCAPEMGRIGTDMQIGGLPRYPVILASHAVRLYQGACSQKSCVIIFLDLRDAFYRLVRPLLSDSSPSDDTLAAIFRTLQLPASAFHSFRDQVCGGSLLTAEGTSEWLRSMLEETLSSTWFHVRQQEGVTRTHLGSRPGDCLADLLFYVTFSDVLRKVQQAVRAQPGKRSIPWCADMFRSVSGVLRSEARECLDLFDVTWMDDLAVLSSFDSAEQALPALSQVAGALVDCCLERGMLPNLSPGKSEAMASLKGTGARSLRSELLSMPDPSAPLCSKHWPTARISLVAHYKHLGGYLHFRGGLRKEVSNRIGQAWGAFLRHKRTIFGHGHVPVTHKVVMFKTLVIPVLLHACGTWPALHEQQHAPLQRAYLNMCRAMLGRHCKEDLLHLGEDRVFALLQLPSLSLWFHFFRLSYLCSFVALAVKPLWALAHAERQWLTAVRSSLCWLWSQIDGGQRYASWEDAWDDWKYDMCHRQRVWKRRLRFALDSATRVEILQDGWQFCRGTALRLLLSAGGVVQAWTEQTRSGRYACGPCQRLFPSRQAWAVHAFKKHGRIREVRKMLDGSHCPICLKQFPANIQLCRHVEYSVHCQRQLRARGFVGVVQPGVGNRKALDGYDFLGVAKQGLGPKLPLASSECHVEDSYRDTRVWQALVDLLFSGVRWMYLGQLFEAYRAAFCSECIDPLVLIDISQQWSEFVCRADVESASLRDVAMHGAVAKWLAENFSVEWLCAEQRERPEQVATYKHSLTGLAMLDFGQVQHFGVVALPADARVGVVCSKRLQAALVADLGSAVVFDLDWCLDHASWCQQVLRGLEVSAFEFLVLCLADLAIDAAVLRAPIKAKPFAAHSRVVACLQAAIGLTVQVWASQRPFAAIWPDLDLPLSAALRRLPGFDY